MQFYIAEIICILEFCHKHGVFHRDLKPENLLMDERGHLKLIDFFTASFFYFPTANNQFLEEAKTKIESFKRKNQKGNLNSAENSSHLSIVGTSDYICPELIEFDECGPSGDLWALGCILFLMSTGQLPFYDSNEFLTFQKIKECHVVYPPVDKSP